MEMIVTLPSEVTIIPILVIYENFQYISNTFIHTCFFFFLLDNDHIFCTPEFKGGKRNPLMQASLGFV